MMTDSPNPAVPAGRTSVRAIVGFLVFCELASGFVQGYYAPLLAAIADHLSVTDADITWFLTVQTLAAAVFVPLLSKLGDIFGHRRMLRIAVVAVLIGTLVTALVPNFTVVLIARVLIGPLAVWLPLEIALVHNRISGDSARKAIGMLVSFLTVGAILGTVASGVVSSVSPSLTVTLLVPCAFVLVSVYAVFFKVPESTTRANPHIDVLGFVGLAVAMVALLGGLRLASTEGFASPVTIGALGLAFAVFVAWVIWERRTPAPAVDVRLVASRALGPIYLTAFLFGMVMFGMQAPMTTFLAADPAVTGYGFAATPGLISAVIAVITLLATVGAATFAYLAKRIGIRAVLLIGAVLAGAGNFILAAFHSTLTEVWIASAVMGIGLGLLLGALPALLAELAPSDQTGIAAGVYNSLRTLGGAAAGAVFGLVLALWVAPGGEFAEIGGYVTVWVLCGLAFVGALVALAFLRVPDGRGTPAHAPAADEPAAEASAAV
ncbi:MFS transporter [Agromyces hippuratus]